MSMAERVNGGYTITDSIHVGDVEYVIGESPIAPARFVTWECKDGDNYYWGHYMGDRLEAVSDLMDRAQKELDFQMELKARAEAAQKNKEKDKERER